MDDGADHGLDDEELRELLLDRCQDGLVSARQLRALGAAPHEIKRLVRRGDLVAVHRGVYVNHHGPLTWKQRAWAAVLVHRPAALTRESALPHPPDEAPIQVAIAAGRTVRRVAGVDAHRTAGFDGRVHWRKSPPRVLLEHAVIDLATDRIGDLAAAFTLVADACRSRLTTPTAVEKTLAERSWVVGRELLSDLLADLRTGACSVLEREWLRLEQVHGLPTGVRRQRAADSTRVSYRDVTYEAFRMIVELDGRAYHDTAASYDRDAGRDLDAAVGSDHLTARGWDGTITDCPGCPGPKDT
jgi:hypothetical protein